MPALTLYYLPALAILLPLLRSPFGCMMAGGIAVFMLSACSRSPKASARFQAIAFVIFTAGSVMIVKGIAEAYQR